MNQTLWNIANMESLPDKTRTEVSKMPKSKDPPFKESELASTIGFLVIRSSELDYLLRHTLALFIAEDITDNRLYEKAHLIGTKFNWIGHVVDLLKELAPWVLCAWYRQDFAQLFAEVQSILDKRNTHSHQVFHIFDEDTYQMSSVTDHHLAKMGRTGAREKLRKRYSLKELKELVLATSECTKRLQ